MAIEKNQRIKAEDVRQGLTIWDPNLEYQVNATCYYANEDEGIPYTIYRNITGNNTSTNPSEDTTNWEALKLGGGGASLPMFYDHRFPSKPQDVSWVNSENYSWLYKTPYIGAYNYLVKRYQPTGKFREGNTYYVVIFSDGDIQTTDVVVVSGTVSDLQTWATEEGYTTTGSSIEDLVVSKTLTAETETIAGTTITFYRCYDKKKIVLPTEVTNVDAIYTATGIAEYFILDIENLRFKLPRNKWGHYGTGNGDLGDYIEESVPNAKGAGRGVGASTDVWTGTFKYLSSPGNSGHSSVNESYANFDFDLSRSSSAYKDGAPVQPRGTQGDLYFYLGSANLDEIIGINFDTLNSKANVELNNLDDKGKNIANWSSNVTNCIASYSNRVNIQVSDDKTTLTIYAGLNLYFADGYEDDGTTPKFEEHVMTTTKTKPVGSSTDGEYYLIYDDAIPEYRIRPLTNAIVGNTAPSTSGSWLWYNDTANRMYVYDGATQVSDKTSLPIARFTVYSGAIKDLKILDTVSEMASAAFTLPGLRALAPNKRNVDNTAKSDLLVVNRVCRGFTNSGIGGKTCVLAITQGGIANGRCFIVPVNTYRYSDAQPADNSVSSRWFSPHNNMFYLWNTDVNAWREDIQAHVADLVVAGSGMIQDGLMPRYPLQLAGNNEFNEHRLVDFQQPTSANNYTWYRLYSDGWVEQGGIKTHANAQSITVSITLLIPMLDVNYTILAMSGRNDATIDSPHAIGYSTQTTSSFQYMIYRDTNWGSVSTTSSWLVMGMSAI